MSMKMYEDRLASLLYTRENDSFPQRWVSIRLYFLNTINLTYFWSTLSPKAAVMTARLQISKNGTNGHYQGLKSCLWWPTAGQTLIHLIPTRPCLFPSRSTVSPSSLEPFQTHPAFAFCMNYPDSIIYHFVHTLAISPNPLSHRSSFHLSF